MSLPARLQKFFGDKNMSLIERLRDGKGADRQLDADLWRHFRYVETPEISSVNQKPRVVADGGIWHVDPPFIIEWAPELTSDLNAVFALVERELPGVQVDLLGPQREYDSQHVAAIWTTDDSNGTGWHTNRCHALLLALLAAKEPRP